MKPQLKKGLFFTKSSYFTPLNNSSGSMLLYVLLTTAIVFTLAVPILNNSIKSYSLSTSSADRIQLNSYQNQIKNLFKNLNICSCNLINVEFDPAMPQRTSSLNSLHMGCTSGAKTIFQKNSSSSNTTAIHVSDIYITDITQPTGLSSNEYNVKLAVTTETTLAKTLSLRSEPISLTVYTTTASSPGASHTARKIIGCGRSPASSPQSFSTTSNSGTIQLSWNSSSGPGPIFYQVRMASSSQNLNSGVTVCNTANTQCAVKNLASGINYCFAVQAVSPYGVSSMSSSNCISL